MSTKLTPMTYQVAIFRAIALKHELRFYLQTGMKANLAHTPTAMLRMATVITGVPFKRGQYSEAIMALDEWLAKY